MYRTAQIKNAEFLLSYRFYPGNENRTLILFHGFGQSNTVFDSFAMSLLTDYSVISIDLFFHGESTLTENKANRISVQQWNEIIDRLLIKHAIDRFSLLSFSMGSRFIVSLLNVYAARIDKIVLIAPDGFGNNFWFRVATSTAVSRSVFRFTMFHPAWLKTAVYILGAAGIFNSITKRFIERNLESAEHRKKIYRSWVSFRELKISSSDFVKFISAYNIRFMCFCGKEDQLVAKETIQLICNQTASPYIEMDLAHHKMIQALEQNELRAFLVADR